MLKCWSIKRKCGKIMFGETIKILKEKYCILTLSGACFIVENTRKLFRQYAAISFFHYHDNSYHRYSTMFPFINNELENEEYVARKMEKMLLEITKMCKA